MMPRTGAAVNGRTNDMTLHNPDIPRPSRRHVLKTASAGFGYLAFAGLCAEAAAGAGPAAGYQSPLAPRPPQFAARAKRVIFLCMKGGPSQMETFDYKPRLQADTGKPGRRAGCNLFGSRWKFAQHGGAGLWVSELFPHLARHADELCVLKAMHTDNENHPQALEQLHTGSFQFTRPSIGSWVLYGLGTENQNLPGFITVSPPASLGAARYYGSAFLPALYQGTPIGEEGKPVEQARVGNLGHPRLSPAGQRRHLDLVQSMNRGLLAKQQETAQLEGVIESFELAFRMQDDVPKVMDLSGESAQTLEAYGIGGGKPTDDFGRQCLLARRFAEAGVRFIELTHGDWDTHGFVSSAMPKLCGQIDQPIAALLADLKQRGMLDDTLIVWGGEFGRLPDDPTKDGRGHNSAGYTMWLAGGGARPGHAHGATDDHGYAAVDGKVHLHDLHATILHLLGLDHERLTYRYAGRDFRLTDVHGRVVKELLA